MKKKNLIGIIGGLVILGSSVLSYRVYDYFYYDNKVYTVHALNNRPLAVYIRHRKDHNEYRFENTDGKIRIVAEKADYPPIIRNVFVNGREIDWDEKRISTYKSIISAAESVNSRNFCSWED